MDILVRKAATGSIPVLELVPQAAGSFPLVLLYHGYTARKEFILAQGYHLAANGFFVAMPDAWGHGDRASGGYCDFLEAVTRTCAEIDPLLAAYGGRKGVDASRSGLAGYSMGGCITFSYLSSGGRGVKAAAPIIGSPDWLSILGTPDARLHFEGQGIAADSAAWEEAERRARALQPASHPQTMSVVPLLVQNGEADTLIPAGPVRAFCDALRGRYREPGNLRCIGYPGVGHSDTVAMNVEMVSWFRTHLSPGASNGERR